MPRVTARPVEQPTQRTVKAYHTQLYQERDNSKCGSSTAATQMKCSLLGNPSVVFVSFLLGLIQGATALIHA